MLSELDTPEFTGMLATLLDDLASGDFIDQPQLSSSTINGRTVFSDTVSIGNDTKTYILTRVENTVKKKQEKKFSSFKLIKPSMGKPRTVKTDIRASFGIMIANVCNGNDFPKLLKLFQTYCMSDLAFRIVKRHPISNELVATDLVGPLMFSNLVYANMTICPDCVAKVVNSKLDGNGIVTCTLLFTMSRVYNISSIHQVLPNMVVDLSPTPPSVAEQEVADKLSSLEIVNKMEAMKKSLPLRKTPIKVIHKVKIVITTNDHKRMSVIKANLHVVENDYSIED